MNPENSKSRPAKKLVVIALISFCMVALFGPYFVLAFQSALIVSFSVSVLLATGLGVLCRSQGLKTSLAFGTYIFLVLLLSSASLGVFFIFTFGKALLAFLAISIVGMIVLTVAGFFVARLIYPNLLKPATDAAPFVNLIVLRSPNIDRAVTFYQAMGFHFTKHRHGTGPEHYSSEIAGLVFELYPLGPDHQPTTAARVGFSVDDVDSVVQSLEEAGGTIISHPKNSKWGRRAVVKDLDDHSIEVITPPNLDEIEDCSS